MRDYGAVGGAPKRWAGKTRRMAISAVIAASIVFVAILGALLVTRHYSTGSLRSTQGKDVVVVLRSDVTEAEVRVIVQDLSSSTSVRSFHFVSGEKPASLQPCYLPSCGPSPNTDIQSSRLSVKPFLILVMPTDVRQVSGLINRLERVLGVLRVSSERS